VPTDNANIQKTAGDLLYSQVYVPAFFTKLAEFGYEPRTEVQAQSLLRQAQMLRQAKAAEMAKQAADQGDPLLIAEQRLAERLGQINAGQAAELQIEKYAADFVAQHPELAKAALDYQNAVAQDLLDAQKAS